MNYPNRVVDGSTVPWYSCFANKRVVLNVYLGRPSTVNKIMIKFALRPKKFEIFFLRLNRAESYYKYE